MYKLVVLSGPNSESYELESGEYVLGRGDDVDIRLEGKGVSKRHCKITCSRREVNLVDIGSSNGTFVNGSLTRIKRLRPGDRISIGNFILELRKKPISKKSKNIAARTSGAVAGGIDGNLALSSDHLPVSSMSAQPLGQLQIQSNANLAPDQTEDKDFEEKAPRDPVAKLKWIVRRKILPKLYKLNETYEWRQLLVVLFGIFVLINIFFSIPEILKTNEEILLSEVKNRGYHYARDMSVVAKEMLSSGRYTQLDADFLEQEEGYKDFEITDLEGRIYAPVGRQGEWSNDPFTKQNIKIIKRAFRKGNRYKPRAGWIGENEIGIAYPVSVFDASRGIEKPIGIVVIRFAPGSLNVKDSNVNQIYINTFITSILIGAILLFFLYKLTLFPIEELGDQMDLVLKGAQERIEMKQKMSELDPLVGVISSTLKQLKTLRDRSDDSGSMDVFEESSEMVMEKYRFVAVNSENPFIILDPDYKILCVNENSDEILGIREADALGEVIFDSSHDETFTSMVVELCEKAAMTPGEGLSDDLDIAGVNYKVSASAVTGNDSQIKIFLIVVSRDEV